MTRSEFIKMFGLLGIGLPLQSPLTSFAQDDVPLPNDKETVIIIGAGAAGLTAAYLLNQQGINSQILEATSDYGGRMKRTLNFANFPIPLGAEWLHVESGIFDEIINDSSIQANINTIHYKPDIDYGLFEGNKVSLEDIDFTIDQKFINATWFDFFEEYLIPSVGAQISFKKVITSIDYTKDKIFVKTANETFSADKVIVTVPVKILQNGVINFVPELPKNKVNAIKNVTVWDGCKAFIEFSEKFYPTFIGFDITPESAGQKLYYDAAYGQNTSQNILGLFAVGEGTLPYINLSDSELKDYMLAELDKIFDGQASPNYIKHIFQNWNEEPYANGAYVYDQENWKRIRTLGKSVENKLFFAGDAYTEGEDWSSVHTAVRSAKRAIEELLG